jgi:hypothetical protein
VYHPPKPELTLSVCYVVSNNVVTGAQFGYQAKNLDEDPYIFQLITPHYALPFAKPPIGMDSDLIWSTTYPFPLKYGDIAWLVTIDKAFGLAVVDKDVKVNEALKHQCPPPPPPPFVGYSIPHVILYKGSELTNGFGVIVSTESYATVPLVIAAFGMTTLPDDVKPVCEGPVTQMSPDDMQGKWVCDPLLIGILANGHSGIRLPLISDTGNSLQKIYWVLTGVLPWTATP